MQFRQFPQNACQAIPPQAQDILTDTQFVEIIKRLMAQEQRRGAWQQSQFLPTSEPIRMLIWHFSNQNMLTRLKRGEGLERTLLKFSISAGNKVTMRIFERLTQKLGHCLLQTRRDGMFQRLSLGINLAPIDLKNLMEEQFYQPMSTDDSSSFFQTNLTQPGPSTRFVLDEPQLCQPLQHPRH